MGCIYPFRCFKLIWLIAVISLKDSRYFYVLKDIARYVLSYSKPLELLPVKSCQREKKKSSFSFFRAQPMFEGTSKTLPCRVGSLSEVGLPMFQSDDMLHKLIIFGNYGSKDRTKLDIEVCSYRKRMARNTILPSFT